MFKNKSVTRSQFSLTPDQQRVSIANLFDAGQQMPRTGLDWFSQRAMGLSGASGGDPVGLHNNTQATMTNQNAGRSDEDASVEE